MLVLYNNVAVVVVVVVVVVMVLLMLCTAVHCFRERPSSCCYEYFHLDVSMSIWEYAWNLFLLGE